MSPTVIIIQVDRRRQSPKDPRQRILPPSVCQRSANCQIVCVAGPRCLAICLPVELHNWLYSPLMIASMTSTRDCIKTSSIQVERIQMDVQLLLHSMSVMSGPTMLWSSLSTQTVTRLPPIQYLTVLVNSSPRRNGQRRWLDRGKFWQDLQESNLKM